MSTPSKAGAFALLGLLFGCNGSETSIALIFPNEVAKNAVRRLQVEAYNPETNSASAMARDCSDFSEKAKMGQKPLGTPDPGDFSCPTADMCPNNWFVDKEIKKVQSGKKIVYVLAYATTEESATPILEGCNDRFDSAGGGDERNDVPVELKLVIPESARLVKAAGDRQVGRASEDLGVPLTIRVEADAPSGSGGPYVIPGVPLVFTSKNPEFRMTTGDNPVTFSTYSDQNGQALIQLKLPDQPGQGDVEVEAKILEGLKNGDGSTRSIETFSVSVTAPINFPTKELITPAGNNRPIAAAIGQIVPGGPKELAVLSCTGNDTTCRIGTEAVAPYGETKLTVLTDLGGGKVVVPLNPAVTASLGILPAGITTGNISTAAGDDIAIVNSRRNTCQDRRCLPNAPCGCYRPDPSVEIACPCEGSEVLLFSASGGNINLDKRLTMTGSNAVALAAVKQGPGALLNIVVAAQGRSKQERPCTRSSRCLPYEPPGCNLTDPGRFCGCPPAERCECFGANCMDTQTPGVCVARDKMIDQLTHKPATNELFNHFGCQEVELSCNNTGDAMGSTCTCLDKPERGNNCQGKDGCNCHVPDRVQIGDTDAPVPPNGLAAGQIDGTEEWDLVVPSIGGLELIESKVSQGNYAWKGQPIVNAPIHAALVAQMDNNTPNEGPDSPADVVWYSRKACLDGTNFLDRCPIWRDLPAGAEAQGCLGIYFTAGARSVLELRTPMVGGCRRHFLTYTPDGFCAGDFNYDGALDIVVSSRTMNELQVFSGDGRGGLLDPPESIMLPGGAGGPMACGDVDGDQIDDVIVLDIATGGIQILKKRIVSGASDSASATGAASRKLRRSSPRKERFWLSFDRRILYSIAGVALVVGILVFGAGVGVGRALAPLVPEGPQPRRPVAAVPEKPVSLPKPTSAAAVIPQPEAAPEPEPPQPIEAPAAELALRTAPTDGYGLQLGAFESEADASVFLREHAEALSGLPIHLVPTKIPKKGIWYRVRVGAYADKGDAETAKSRLDPKLARSAIVVSYR